MTIQVTTNNVPRDTVAYYDLPDSAREEFDYLAESEHYDTRFFKYRNEYYDYYEFMRVQSPELSGWDGIRSDSVWTGIVIKYILDTDQVIVGSYFG